MYAIVSLLDQEHYSQIEKLWRELEFECGLAGVTLTPLPHFSWHIATEYDFKRLDAALTGQAAQSEPFTVRTSGLGLFTGAAPVMFIPLVKDPFLARYHHQIWSQVNPFAISPSTHYEPEAWVPHITLAYGDVDAGKLSCAVEKVAFRRFNWEIEIDNLALVYQLSGQVGKLQSKYSFKPGRSGAVET